MSPPARAFAAGRDYGHAFLREPARNRAKNIGLAVATATATSREPGGDLTEHQISMREPIPFGPNGGDKNAKVAPITPSIRDVWSPPVTGKVIEWYDNGCYWLLAAQVGRDFLTAMNRASQLGSSYAVIRFAFLMPPLAGMRLRSSVNFHGRKQVLVLSLLSITEDHRLLKSNQDAAARAASM